MIESHEDHKFILYFPVSPSHSSTLPFSLLHFPVQQKRTEFHYNELHLAWHSEVCHADRSTMSIYPCTYLNAVLYGNEENEVG